MQLNEYQQQAAQYDLMDRTAALAANDPAYVAKILGLVGEAGEVAEKYKKIIRDKAGHVSADDTPEIMKELGDVLWYVSALARYLGVSLEEIAALNLEKLGSRKERGVSRGAGDNR